MAPRLNTLSQYPIPNTLNKKYQQFRNLLLDVGIKPANLAFCGISFCSCSTSIPSLEKHQKRVSIIRTEIKHRETSAEKLERQLNYEQRQARIANERYKSCLPVVGNEYRNDTHYFTGIKEGDKPRDKITGKQLPKGTVICDAHGNTAVIDKKGAVSYLAFTGNRNVIQSRLKRFRGSQYSQPVIGE